MKNFIKIITLSLIGALVSFSCEKDILIDTDPLDKEYVIEGNITNGFPPVVRVTRTGFYYDSINSKTIEDLYVHDAVVTVFDGSRLIYLKEVCEQEVDADYLFKTNTQVFANYLRLSIFDARIYFKSLSYEEKKAIVVDIYPYIPFTCRYVVPFGAELIGQEGFSYDLMVTTPDSVEMTSTTTIPEHFYVDSLTYEYVNTDYPNLAKVSINFSFPKNQYLGNYVRFGSKIQGGKYYYGGVGGSVYSDAMVVGSSNLKIPLQYNNPDKEVPIEIRSYFKRGDTASLIWHNIGRETYDFFYSVENDGGSSPFSTPTTALSNINGGLGVWGGYNTSVYSIYLP